MPSVLHTSFIFLGGIGLGMVIKDIGLKDKVLQVEVADNFNLRDLKAIFKMLIAIQIDPDDGARFFKALRSSYKTDSDAFDALVRFLEKSTKDGNQASGDSMISKSCNDSSYCSSFCTGYVISAAAFATFGYGCMRFMGLTISDLINITKSKTARALSITGRNLKQISALLTGRKKHSIKRKGILGEQKVIPNQVHMTSDESESNLHQE
ncbi:hypothetical protein FRX31_027642 [Thalictrum thalictroides]|uniref:Uncharacterized protein n=1 Tax=Thalictrum thalictroides TaxID=46969 RepID=A0A7J6VDL4_THATH|nr:hypothetical protein FRX31_027642 [Thalictrum thalictroides]